MYVLIVSTGVLLAFIIVAALFVDEPRARTFRMYGRAIRMYDRSGFQDLSDYLDFYIIDDACINDGFAAFEHDVLLELQTHGDPKQLYIVMQHLLRFEPALVVKRNNITHVLEMAKCRGVLDHRYRPIKPK